jgi:hypothetical protein
MPTTDMNRTMVSSASVASAIARVAMPPYGDRSLLGGRRTTCSARSSSRAALARDRVSELGARGDVSEGALHLVAREHLVGELERLRAPQGAGHETLQLPARGEFRGDALEDTVADERARKLLRK